MRYLPIMFIAAAIIIAEPAAAQFTGPSAKGSATTVAGAEDLPLGAYVTLTGHIVEHLREDYYRFADDTGTIRVEIDEGRWQERAVTPETRLRLTGEVDPYHGGRYVWVTEIEVLD